MSSTVSASCFCGQLRVTSSVPNENLPLQLWLCSCNICRWFSGTLAISAVLLHHPIDIKGKATRYATSTGSQGLYRCFCPVCGTHVHEESLDTQKIGLYGGAMDKVEGVLKLQGLIFASSTRDGGIATWLSDHPVFDEWSESHNSREVVLANPQKAIEDIDRHETLRCSCHCTGVNFRITRPNEGSYNLSSPYSDSLVPRSVGADHLNSKDEKWWIRDNGKKYAAAVCACDSCRRSSGQDLVQWAFIPKVNIIGENDQPYDFSTAALTSFKSSDGVKRYFCNICGANVFFTWEDRPDLIDVSVGLLRSSQGSRAEDWLEWFTRISFVEDAQNRELVDSVKKGLGDYNQGKSV